MTYRELREVINIQKQSHQHESMDVTHFGRFAIMKSEKTQEIIVDNDI